MPLLTAMQVTYRAAGGWSSLGSPQISLPRALCGCSPPLLQKRKLKCICHLPP